MGTALHTHTAPLELGRLHAGDERDLPVETLRLVPVPMPPPDRVNRAVAEAVAEVEARETFCAELVAQRLRMGLTLEAMSTATKINASVFAQLERGDLSHWPRGIYRRAFFRDYVTAIGLPLEETMAAFTELFPDGAGPLPPHTAVSALGRQPLRLTMAAEPAEWTLRPSLLLAASADGLGVVGVSAAISFGLGVPFTPTLALTALLYSLATTACLGRGVAAWWIERGVLRRRDSQVRGVLRAVAPQSDAD